MCLSSQFEGKQCARAPTLCTSVWYGARACVCSEKKREEKAEKERERK